MCRCVDTWKLIQKSIEMSSRKSDESLTSILFSVAIGGVANEINKIYLLKTFISLLIEYCQCDGSLEMCLILSN